MIETLLAQSVPAVASAAAARGDLALALQEPLTVAVRLRGGRPVATDASSFRLHVKQLLSAADARARGAGYDGETVRLAIYAYIALLDESVLTSGQPMFADWARQPLQEEVFGEHMAGENFFRIVQELLGRQDSDALADLLEVYQLCLLLGFHGRYGRGEPAGLQVLSASLQSKIERIRGPVPTELVPDWNVPVEEAVVRRADPWTRRLALAAGAAFLVALVLFVFYAWRLAGQLAELRVIT